MKLDIYQTVTDSLVARLEEGTSPWRKRWTTGGAGMIHAPRRATGEHYRGINVLLLWIAAETGGYQSDRWFTFNQAKALGACVRKGEKATPIIFYKTLDVERTNDAGDTEEKRIPMLRQFYVFNADQIDGLPERYIPAPIQPGDAPARNELAEAALRSCGADIRESGDKAFYVPSHDYVNMPTFERFESAGGFLATLAHELCHWTGHKTRLDRAQLNSFGSKDYAYEELIAEIGSAFVGARLGIVGEHIDNHAAYLASWLKALKNDKRMIFKAAAAAQLAADMVLANADPLPADTAEEEADDAPAPVDPAIAERAKERAALKVRAPMRAPAEQASTAGLGLFDFHDAPAML